MSSLISDVARIHQAWQAIDVPHDLKQRAVVPVDDARRDVVVHVPQTCLHGVVCRDCHTVLRVRPRSRR